MTSFDERFLADLAASGIRAASRRLDAIEATRELHRPLSLSDFPPVDGPVIVQAIPSLGFFTSGEWAKVQASIDAEKTASKLLTVRRELVLGAGFQKVRVSNTALLSRNRDFGACE